MHVLSVYCTMCHLKRLLSVTKIWHICAYVSPIFPMLHIIYRVTIYSTSVLQQVRYLLKCILHTCTLRPWMTSNMDIAQIEFLSCFHSDIRMYFCYCLSSQCMLLHATCISRYSGSCLLVCFSTWMFIFITLVNIHFHYWWWVHYICYLLVNLLCFSELSTDALHQLTGNDL